MKRRKQTAVAFCMALLLASGASAAAAQGNDLTEVNTAASTTADAGSVETAAEDAGQNDFYPALSLASSTWTGQSDIVLHAQGDGSTAEFGEIYIYQDGVSIGGIRVIPEMQLDADGNGAIIYKNSDLRNATTFNWQGEEVAVEWTKIDEMEIAVQFILGDQNKTKRVYVPIDFGAAEPTNPTEPTTPTNPTEPTEPTEPTSPTEPTNPTEPTSPTEPTNPTEPITPTEPTNPTEPTSPTNPTEPTSPTNPTTPTNPADPTNPTEPEGSVTLENQSGVTMTLSGKDAEGLTLQVAVSNGKEEQAAVGQVVSIDGNKMVTYDLSLLKNGQPYAYSGQFTSTVSLPIPKGWDMGQLALYHVGEGAGEVTPVAFSVDQANALAVFQTNHFSKYVLVQKAAASDAENPANPEDTDAEGKPDDTVGEEDGVETGDASNWMIWGTIAALSVIGGLTALGAKRKKTV